MPKRCVHDSVFTAYEDPYARLSAAIIYSAVSDYRSRGVDARMKAYDYFQSFEFDGHAALCKVDPELFRKNLGVLVPRERKAVEKWEVQLKWLRR